MWNRKVKELVEPYELVKNLYDVGPIQKAMLEDFVEDVVEAAALVIENAVMHRLPASSYANLLREEFNFKD